MGNESSTLELAEKRLVNATAFIEAIASFETPEPGTSSSSKSSGPTSLRVAIRKRPLNAVERQRGEFDVVNVQESHVDLHRALFRLDDKHMYLDTHRFGYADAVFRDTQSTQEVFAKCVEPLLHASLSRTAPCCVMAFGATGSGKTYTMDGIRTLTAEYIFSQCSKSNAPTQVGGGGGGEGHDEEQWRCSAVQVSGGAVDDLLSIAPQDSSVSITLLEDENGHTHLRGGTWLKVESASALEEVFRSASAARVTKATGVHDASSRSHLVLRLGRVNGIASDGWVEEGNNTTAAEITLVDLAGSEWERDQRKHNDADLRREAAQINTSLFTLRHCLAQRRARSTSGCAGGSWTKHRESKLTRVLKNIFTDEVNTTIIGTISPGSSDTEHTFDVLGHLHVCAMGDAAAVAPVVTTPVEGITKHRSHLVSPIDEPSVSCIQTLSGTADSAVPSLPPDPTKWTPAQVCDWWHAAAAAALAAVQEAPSAGSPEPPSTFEVRLSAKRWVALRVDGKDSVGLAFETNPATKVKSVLSRGFVTMSKWHRSRRLVKGCTLVEARAVYESNAAPTPAEPPTGSDPLKDLKQALTTFKATIRDVRLWEQERAGFMTEDMKALRRLVMEGPAPIYQGNADAGTEGAGVGARGDGEGEGLRATDTVGEDESEAPQPSRPPPPDCLLVLRFRDVEERRGADEGGAEGISTGTTVDVPVIFTGLSRTGETWSGRELVDKFDEARFLYACGGQRRFATAMLDDLRRRLTKGKG